jgi:hypothetical protein
LSNKRTSRTLPLPRLCKTSALPSVEPSSTTPNLEVLECLSEDAVQGAADVVHPVVTRMTMLTFGRRARLLN